MMDLTNHTKNTQEIFNAINELFEKEYEGRIKNLMQHNTELEKLARKKHQQIEDLEYLEDCRDIILEIGSICGCEHVDSKDDRMMQRKHIKEYIFSLQRRVAVLEKINDALTEALNKMDDNLNVLNVYFNNSDVPEIVAYGAFNDAIAICKSALRLARGETEEEQCLQKKI